MNNSGWRNEEIRIPIQEKREIYELKSSTKDIKEEYRRENHVVKRAIIRLNEDWEKRTLGTSRKTKCFSGRSC